MGWTWYHRIVLHLSNAYCMGWQQDTISAWKWLHGKSLSIFLHLCVCIWREIVNQRIDQEAQTDSTRICDIKDGSSTEALFEYLQLWVWDIYMQGWPHPWNGGSALVLIWASSPLGQFMTRSAYCFNLGAVEFEPWKKIWRSWAPPHCRFFVWLASQKCWTSDCLTNEGHDHPEQWVANQPLLQGPKRPYKGVYIHVKKPSK